MIDKLKIDFEISGTKISIPFETICSVTDKKFKGFVIVEYYPNKEVIEYVSLEKHIQQISKQKITAEELANNVFEDVKETIKPKYLKVLIDIKSSDAHQPAEVWIETKE